MSKTFPRTLAGIAAAAAVIGAPAVAVLATAGPAGSSQAAPQQGGIGNSCPPQQGGIGIPCTPRQGGIGW
ncbi:hypothetical protein [Gordonia aichiensis]|uniref:hypothetical protein n=1 Tax=Gordonia aichiensis TaxID=36820 RepID=UPI003266239F